MCNTLPLAAFITNLNLSFSPLQTLMLASDGPVTGERLLSFHSIPQSLCLGLLWLAIRVLQCLAIQCMFTLTPLHSRGSSWQLVPSSFPKSCGIHWKSSSSTTTSWSACLRLCAPLKTCPSSICPSESWVAALYNGRYSLSTNKLYAMTW